MNAQTAFAFVPAEPPGKPRQIVTDSSEAFFALCARDRSGELVIERVSVGDGNAQWLCDVRYLDE